MIASAPFAPSAPPTLRAQIEEALGRRCDDEFLVLSDMTLSYGELDRLSNAAANVLLERGAQEGGVVTTLCNNGIAIVATWFACIKIGAVFCPLNARLTGEPLRHAMARAAGSVVVCDADLADAASAATRTAPHPHAVLIAGAAPTGADSFDRALDCASTEPPPQPTDWGAAPARLLLTSSTTGASKAVLWSRHAEALHATKYGEELIRVSPGETVFACLPLFHVTCQGTLLGTLLCGGRIVIARRFDPFAFWEQTRAAGAVFFPYVGTILSTLMARPPRDDDTENPVRRAMGSAAPTDSWQRFEQRFGVQLEDVWGQTETASCWTHVPSTGARPGTVGIPADRFDARLTRTDGAEALTDEPAELWIRPHEPNVIFEGYVDRAQVRQALDQEGWYHTGDLLSRDAQGYYAFRGRLRESIRRRGETIAPAEIESAAMQHPAVLEAAAVGILADDGVEDEILLCIVLRPTEATTPAEVEVFLRRTLPRFMVPRFIRLMTDLPKTATTRVRRLSLRDLGRAGAWDSRSAGDGRG